MPHSSLQCHRVEHYTAPDYIDLVPRERFRWVFDEAPPSGHSHIKYDQHWATLEARDNIIIGSKIVTIFPLPSSTPIEDQNYVYHCFFSFMFYCVSSMPA
jgi:hypothetical protein